MSRRQLARQNLTYTRAVRTFTVTSDRLAGAKRGDTVTEEQLEGCNVDALVAGGHLVEGKPDKEKGTK